MQSAGLVTSTGDALQAELLHLLLRQGELFKGDGEVASARPQSISQQRYLMTAKSSMHAAHVGPGPDADSDLPDSQLRLEGLVQQEQVLKKQVSRNKHTRCISIQHRTHVVCCNHYKEGHRVMFWQRI